MQLIYFTIELRKLHLIFVSETYDLLIVINYFKVSCSKALFRVLDLMFVLITANNRTLGSCKRYQSKTIVVEMI